MEPNSFVIRHWDDVVFENRNKDYGAYLLRKAYVKRLLSGLGVTVALVGLLLSGPMIFQNENAVIVVPPFNPGGTIFTRPPLVERIPPRSPIGDRTRIPGNKTIMVTRDSVVESPEPLPDQASDANGEDQGLLGSSEGIGPNPIEPAPIVLPDFLDVAEVMPAYEGGVEGIMKFIQKKIRFPRAPKSQGIEGTVYVRFIVNGDGSVSDVEVIKGVHPDYDKEAIRVISQLPSWKGGSHNGMPVSVRMVLPIKFNLRQ
ncbi:MAG: energy transducer TonB [Cyclobacteriaceae bacterium]